MRAEIMDDRLGGADPAHRQPVCRHMPDAADHPGPDLRLQFQEGVMIADQMPDHHLAAGCGCCCRHPFGLVKCNGEGFFDIDMATGGKRRQGEIGMCGGGGGDHHAVKHSFCQQPVDRHRAGAEFLGKPGGAAIILIGNRRQCAERGKVASQIPAPHAAANQSDACHRHLFPHALGDACEDACEFVACSAVLGHPYRTVNRCILLHDGVWDERLMDRPS